MSINNRVDRYIVNRANKERVRSRYYYDTGLRNKYIPSIDKVTKQTTSQYFNSEYCKR